MKPDFTLDFASIDYDELKDQIFDAFDNYGNLEITFQGIEKKPAFIDSNHV